MKNELLQKSGRADLIIIGAGPVGLLLASLLGKRGRHVIIAERRTQPAEGSMAIGITPPSLRILKKLDLDCFNIFNMKHNIRPSPFEVALYSHN